MWVCATTTQPLLPWAGNAEFEFSSSKTPMAPVQPSTNDGIVFQPPLSCSPRLPGKEERRKDHEHVSKRSLFLAGCIFQSQPDTDPCIRSVPTTIQGGASASGNTGRSVAVSSGFLHPTLNVKYLSEAISGLLKKKKSNFYAVKQFVILNFKYYLEESFVFFQMLFYSSRHTRFLFIYLFLVLFHCSTESKVNNL